MGAEVFRVVAGIWDSTHPQPFEKTMAFEKGPRNPLHGKKGRPEKTNLGWTLLAGNGDLFRSLPYLGDSSFLPTAGDFVKIQLLNGQEFFVSDEGSMPPEMWGGFDPVKASQTIHWGVQNIMVEGIHTSFEDSLQKYCDKNSDLDFSKVVYCQWGKNYEKSLIQKKFINEIYEFPEDCYFPEIFEKLIQLKNVLPEKKFLLALPGRSQMFPSFQKEIRLAGLAGEIYTKQFHYGSEVFQLVVDRSRKFQQDQLASGFSRALTSRVLAGPLREEDVFNQVLPHCFILFSSEVSNLKISLWQQSFSKCIPLSTQFAPSLPPFSNSPYSHLFLEDRFSCLPLFLLESLGFCPPGQAGSQLMLNHFSVRNPPALNPITEEWGQFTPLGRFLHHLQSPPPQGALGVFLGAEFDGGIALSFEP